MTTSRAGQLLTAEALSAERQRGVAEKHELHPLEEDARRIPVVVRNERREVLDLEVALQRGLPAVADPVLAPERGSEALEQGEPALLRARVAADVGRGAARAVAEEPLADAGRGVLRRLQRGRRRRRRREDLALVRPDVL